MSLFQPILAILSSLSARCFSIDKAPKIKSPVLVIHGTEDEVIDFSHGLAIHAKCPRAVEPLWVEVSPVPRLIAGFGWAEGV